MRAVVCKEFGPPESLVVEEIADPTPGPGQVVIDVHASALNFPDVLMLEGKQHPGMGKKLKKFLKAFKPLPFTDVVLTRGDGRLHVAKQLSSPAAHQPGRSRKPR